VTHRHFGRTASRSLFQRLLGFLNPLYPRFPSVQLFGGFLTLAIPAVTFILFFIRSRSEV
jgi:hypothetical protein